MTYDGFSNNGLRAMHLGVWRAMMDDDMRPAAARQYGVRATPDWRIHGDRIEAELARRGLWFAALPW